MQSNATSVVLYIRQGKYDQRIWELIQRQSAYGQVEMYNAIDKFRTRMNQTNHSKVIAVLFISDRLELEKIVSFAEVLHDVKTILVLPDREPDTISIGHTLYPRFIGYADSDLQDVAAVLDKMLGLPRAYPN